MKIPWKLTPILAALSACGGNEPDYVATFTLPGNNPVRCETFITDRTSAQLKTDTECVEQPGKPLGTDGSKATAPGPAPKASQPQASGAVPPQPVAIPAPVAAPTQAPQPVAVPAVPAAPAATPQVAAQSNSRAVADSPDVTTLPTIHVVYAVPSGGRDFQRDSNGDLGNTAASMNTWLASVPMGHPFRFDMKQDNSLDATFVQLSKQDRDYVNKLVEIEAELRSSNLIQSGKRYLIFYQGGHFQKNCGESFHNTLSTVTGYSSIVYLNGDADNCFPNDFRTASIKMPLVAIHELYHLFGATHVNDPNNLMYGGPMSDVSTLQIGFELFNNDYRQ